MSTIRRGLDRQTSRQMDGREQDGWMDCVIERLADGGSHAWTDWWVDGDKADKRHKMYV